MATIDDQQVAKLLDDIASIKAIINDSRSVMQQMLLPIHFRVVSFFAGFSIIGISVFYYYLLSAYGEYDRIPEHIRRIGIVIVVSAWLLSMVIKRVLWMRSLKQVDQQITFRQAVRNLYSGQIFHVWIPVIVVCAVVAGYLYLNDLPRYIVPLSAVGIGVIYNMIGSITRIRQYLIAGYWVLITGTLTFFFPSVSALIFLALSHGVCLLLFAALVGQKD